MVSVYLAPRGPFVHIAGELTTVAAVTDSVLPGFRRGIGYTGF